MSNSSFIEQRPIPSYSIKYIGEIKGNMGILTQKVKMNYNNPLYAARKPMPTYYCKLVTQSIVKGHAFT